MTNRIDDQPTFVAHLECSETGKQYPADQLHGLSDAGKPLLVRYDLPALSVAINRDVLRSRPQDIWRYREFLPVREKQSIVSLGESMTPLLPCLNLQDQTGGSAIYIKDEGRLPTGSFKARGLCLAVSMAKELGVKKIAMPTNGNAGAALAAYAARAGIECFVFCPDDTPQINIREIAAQNASVWCVNGYINDCGKIVGDGKAAMNWFDMSTLKEPYRIEGKKTMGLELAEQLNRRNLRAEALNGDIPQQQREKTLQRLKDKRFDLLIATDVVARGLDVPRITHVVNYDMPGDPEAYVHRIGRTGRAGREGDAILFVSRREQHVLRQIERTTRQSIEKMTLPSVDDLNAKRIARFQEQLTTVLEGNGLEETRALVNQLRDSMDVSDNDMATALAVMMFKREPLILKEPKMIKETRSRREPAHAAGGRREDRAPRGNKGKNDKIMRRYRIQVGHDHGVKPGNIVGAIANEAKLPSRLIGPIKIHQDHSTVELPEDLSPRQLHVIRTARVCQRSLDLEAV